MWVLAHGLGGAKNLPIPAGYAFAGACVALAVSFAVLIVAWRRPRFDAATLGRPVPRLAAVVEARWFRVLLRLVGLLFTAYVAFAAVLGPDLLTNPTFGVVYVLLWVGIVPLSLLFGPFYRSVSPVRTVNLLVAKVLGGDPTKGVFEMPARLGYWPAAAGLLAFVWLELVYPSATYLSAVRLWFAVYLAVMLIGGALYGSRWFARADPFEVYSTLVGHLSPWGRRADGVLVVRSPLGNLDGVPAGPGLVGVVAVLFGSTAFDSFKDTPFWLRHVQASNIASDHLNLLALVGFCLLVGLTFAAATMTTGVEDLPRRTLPDLFAHAVVPIVVGYIVAHYLSYFVETGQQTLIQLSDPMGTGANLLGTANWHVGYWLSLHPDFLAVTKVLAVVTGHVLGVIASHDRAVRLLPARHRLTGQLPLLVVMVAYTFGGLSLLFAA